MRVRNERREVGYIIAATPRSGSSYLCELLAATGIAGRPTEYITSDRVHVWRDICGLLSHEEYRSFYLRESRTPNGVFGTKLMWHQLRALAEDLGGTQVRTVNEISSTIDQAIGTHAYLHLRRRDRLRQAISYYRAIVTDRWAWKSPVAPERHPREVFDGAAIEQAAERLANLDALWRSYLVSAGVRWREIYYEDIVDDPQRELLAIFESIGVAQTTLRGLATRRLRRQADSTTEDWVREFNETGRSVTEDL